MNNSRLPKVFLSIIFLSTIIFLVAGCSSEQQPKQHPDTPIKVKQESLTQQKDSQSIVRDKNTNVETVDLNKDGKVFQCPMDYNVISDKEGVCPTCGMNLKEVTVKVAQKNLDAFAGK